MYTHVFKYIYIYTRFLGHLTTRMVSIVLAHTGSRLVGLMSFAAPKTKKPTRGPWGSTF